MNVEVLDVDGDQLVVQTRESVMLIDVLSDHDTRVGHVLSCSEDCLGIDTLVNETTHEVLVAVMDLGHEDDLEETIF